MVKIYKHTDRERLMKLRWATLPCKGVTEISQQKNGILGFRSDRLRDNKGKKIKQNNVCELPDDPKILGLFSLVYFLQCDREKALYVL